MARRGKTSASSKSYLTSNELWPRDYAAQILAISDSSLRTKFLNEQVPDRYRDWVKHLVIDYYEKRKAMREYRKQGNRR